MRKGPRFETQINTREGAEASHSQVIEAQKEAQCGEVAERDDRTAIRINGMNEPTAEAARANGHRRAEEAILAAIEKATPLSLACCRAGASYEFFLQWRKDNREFESQVVRACSVSVEHNLDVIRRAAANGDWKAAAWALERSHPKIFSRPEVQVQLNQQFNQTLNDNRGLIISEDELERVRHLP